MTFLIKIKLPKSMRKKKSHSELFFKRQKATSEETRTKKKICISKKKQKNDEVTSEDESFIEGSSVSYLETSLIAEEEEDEQTEIKDDAIIERAKVRNQYEQLRSKKTSSTVKTAIKHWKRFCFTNSLDIKVDTAKTLQFICEFLINIAYLLAYKPNKSERLLASSIKTYVI
jgi:hypothetical protein